MNKIIAWLARLAPELLGFIGVALGVLIEAQTYFHAGRLPSSVQVAGIVSGAGLPVGSIVAYLAHRLGISKATLNHDISLAGRGYNALSAAVSDLEAAFPTLKLHLDALDSSVAQRLADVIAAVPAPVDLEKVVADAGHLVLASLAKAADPAPAAVAVAQSVPVAEVQAVPVPAVGVAVSGGAAPVDGNARSLA